MHVLRSISAGQSWSNSIRRNPVARQPCPNLKPAPVAVRGGCYNRATNAWFGMPKGSGLGNCSAASFLPAHAPWGTPSTAFHDVFLVRSVSWCARRDSNPHDFTHCHLKAARLPIPPRALVGIDPGQMPDRINGAGCNKSGMQGQGLPRSVFAVFWPTSAGQNRPIERRAAAAAFA
jgi:hypothetical protein